MPTEDQGAQRRARATKERRRRNRRTLTLGAAFAVIVTVLFGAAIATDASAFCSVCHEMTPYTTAWSAGPHAEEAECIDCHVDPGIVNRLAHKPAALGEVFAHFRGDTSFPRPERPDVPDSRCVQCHEDPGSVDEVATFSHPDHVERAACQDCHSVVGHAVTQAALEDADVFDADAAQARAPGILGDAVAAPDAGIANVPGHAEITCTRCHDLARTGCLGCHATSVPDQHPAGAECAPCHPSTASWTFVHPDSESCADCHELPDVEDHPELSDCATCHALESEWAFLHPDRTDCSACHTQPSDGDHPERDDCGTCHSTTGEWRHDR